MKIHTMQLGELSANCYLIECGNGICAAVDIGGDADRVLEYLEKHELKLEAILLTHGHYDHIGGVEEVRAATGARVYIHEKDAVMLGSTAHNLAFRIASLPYKEVTEYQTVKEHDEITVGDQVFTVMHTPGHTAGGVCYLTKDEMFSGDTLFANSIGRTDLGGNMTEMRDSLRRIMTLGRNRTVYPGHGGATILDRERRANPYLRNL